MRRVPNGYRIAMLGALSLSVCFLVYEWGADAGRWGTEGVVPVIVLTAYGAMYWYLRRHARGGNASPLRPLPAQNDRSLSTRTTVLLYLLAAGLVGYNAGARHGLWRVSWFVPVVVLLLFVVAVTRARWWEVTPPHSDAGQRQFARHFAPFIAAAVLITMGFSLLGLPDFLVRVGMYVLVAGGPLYLVYGHRGSRLSTRSGQTRAER